MKKNNPFDSDVADYEEWFLVNDHVYVSELKALEEVLPTSERGVEIGVGTGLFASKLGISHGVDPSEAMAAEARKKGLDVVAGVAEDLPFEDGSFDLALMVTVDCFLDDVPLAFSEIKRILTEEGHLVIAFLDRATPLGQVYEANKHKHSSYKDAHFHTSDDICTLLKDAGFAILDKRQTIFSLDNVFQASKPDHGEGLFAVLKAKKS